MTPQLNTLLLDGDTKSALKTATKEVIREMIAEAAAGKVELPKGPSLGRQRLIADNKYISYPNVEGFIL
jgi:hypothetical protein